MNDSQNLTIGNAPVKLVVFAPPLLAANLLQSFYNPVDMTTVGRIVGGDEFAVIGDASMINFITSPVCIGIAMGDTALAAQYRGAKDECGQIETIGTPFTISLIAVALVTAAGLSAYGPLFQILNVPAATMKDACGCIRTVYFGTISVLDYSAACPILKGLGGIKSLLYFVAVATAVDIVLDLLLTGPFGMGTKGAACITTFSQGISFVIAMIHLKRKNFVFNFQLPHFSIKSHKLAVILKVGLSTAVRMIVVSLSYLLVTRMLNQFGISAVAVSGTGLKINTFAGASCRATGQVVTAMAGQSIGADDTERVRKMTKTGLCLNLFITPTTVLLIQAFGEQLILLFTLANLEMITEGILYSRICYNVDSLIYVVMYTFDSPAIDVGSANTAMINALLGAVIVGLPVSWLLAFPCSLGFPGVCTGQILSPLLPTVVGLLYPKSKD